VIVLLRVAATVFLALVLQCSSAGAEKLISTLSSNKISIGSSFSGSTIVAFGAIQTQGEPPRSYDVTVMVTGPRQSIVARRKERVAGIWVNKGSRMFIDLPSFLGVFANRPLDEIASAEILRAQQIGLKNAILAEQRIDESDPYLANLVEIRTNESMYTQEPRGVTFLAPTAFRVEIPLPQSVMIGEYVVDLKLFAKGALVAQALSTFSVVKVGVEALVVDASVNNSLLYGLATTAMAVLTGWLASIAFRRD
jgi:uncharacterized protein (TIGR02186 family)